MTLTLTPDLQRSIEELTRAFGRVESAEDLRFVCGVASAFGSELETSYRGVERSLRVSMERLERLKSRR